MAETYVDQQIRQIMPAQGHLAAYATEEGGVELEPLIAWALVRHTERDAATGKRTSRKPWVTYRIVAGMILAPHTGLVVFADDTDLEFLGYVGADYADDNPAYSDLREEAAQLAAGRKRRGRARGNDAQDELH